MKRALPWICAIIALLGGILAWRVDSRNDEPQAAVLVLLVVTFPLGFLLPRRAWLWAILAGICLPLGYLVARSLGLVNVPSPEPQWYAASIALIPAFMGAYAGALGRVVLNSLSGSPKG